MRTVNIMVVSISECEYHVVELAVLNSRSNKARSACEAEYLDRYGPRRP